MLFPAFKLTCIRHLEISSLNFFILFYFDRLETEQRLYTIIYFSLHICNIYMHFHAVYNPILTSDPRLWLEALQLLLPGVFQVLSQHNLLVPTAVLLVRVVAVCLLATHPLGVLQQPLLVV